MAKRKIKVRQTTVISIPHFGDVVAFEGRADIPLEDFIRNLSNNCEEYMARNGCVTPMFHIVTRGGVHLILDAPDRDKDISALKIRVLLKLVDAVLYAFCDEAWMAKYDKPEPDVMPSERADRVEIVMIQAESEREGELTAQRKIVRNELGRPMLAPLEIHRWDNAMGRLVGLLPRRGPVQ
jgi:hypothetical protein